MIMKSLFVLTFFIPGIWASVYERKLVEDLLSSRQKRPLNFNRTTDVSTIDKITFNFRLVEVLKLSAKEQVLDTSAWIEQSWIDTSLAWDEAEYGGIDEVTIDYRSIWVPDTVLLNNADSTTMGNSVNKGNDVMISSNGEVRWLAPLVFRSSCKLNVRFFPFDEQFCALEFASWSSINLKIEPGKRRILKNYTESSEWILRGVAVGQVNLKNTNKTAVVYIINIRRQFFYYVLYLITPCLLVSMMATVLFVLPPESGELMVVGVTLLLSLTVFFLLASTHIPETSEVVPLIGRYYSLTIIQISCCLVLSCAVLRMHQASFGTVSAWYRRFVFRHLAKIVRVTVPQEFLRNDGQVAAETAAENAPKSSSGLQRLADRLKRKEASDKQQGEWQLAARIFNKLFLFVYMLVVALTIAGIFLQIPQLFENESDYSLATFDGYSTSNVLSKNRLEVHKNA